MQEEEIEEIESTIFYYEDTLNKLYGAFPGLNSAKDEMKNAYSTAYNQRARESYQGNPMRSSMNGKDTYLKSGVRDSNQMSQNFNMRSSGVGSSGGHSRYMRPELKPPRSSAGYNNSEYPMELSPFNDESRRKRKKKFI